MKPLFLSIEGLQSFQEKQEIDFEKIGRDGLFGIFGPTGSGKSTIIDGMTLALYGNIIRFKNNSSSESKDFFDIEAINKNSQGAKVNFKFKVGENIYRVERSYKIGKKSGKLTKTAVLFKNENGEDIKIAENYKEIYKEVKENILGLTLEDFTRSVVLPQGNFSQFLKLTGTEKRDMLERIFNLEKYGDILSKKANAHKYNLESQLKNLDIELSAIGFNEEELNKQLEEFNLLEKETENLKKEEKELKAEIQEMEEIRVLEENISKFQKQKDELDKNSEYIEELEIKKNMAEKFIPVIEKIHKKNDYEDRINILNDEIKTDKEKLEQAVKQLEAKKEVYRSLEEKENFLEKEKQENYIPQEEFLKASEDYKSSIEKENLTEKKEILTKEIKNLEIQKEKLSDDIKIFTDILESLEKEKSEIKDISQDEILNLEKEILQKKSLCENLEKREKELEKTVSDKEKLEKNIKVSEEKLSKLEKEENICLADRKNYFIHEIEKELHEGDICPVCHGIYHKHSESEKESSFNEEVFEKLQNDIRNIKSSVQIEKDKLAEQNKKIEEIKNEIEILPNIKEEIENLENQKENLNKKLKEIADKKNLLEENIKEKNDTLNNNKILFIKTESDLNSKINFLDEIEKNLKEIPEFLLSTDELKENLENIKKKNEIFKNIDLQLNELRKEKKEIWDTKITVWTDKIKNFETQLIQKEENHKNIKTEYLALSEEINKVLLENKISDLKYINEIEKSIDKISHMKEEIEKHKNDTVYVLKMILDYKDQLKNRNFSKEKFENLAERDKIVNMCLEKNIRLLGEITKSIEIFNINKKRAEEILKEKEKIEKKLNPAKEMTELLKGRKFLDFLSAGKLQSITRIASETLQRITNGRYRINVDEKSDFSIMDNFNSAVRKPQSLSGGETFMVSLCLALALANQIQLKGKSKLEFFFLDEGFGTLDSELLEIVFSVLENLKAEGMTVGIITHVEEIKNRVARKLMVYPAQVGISGTVVKEI